MAGLTLTSAIFLVIINSISCSEYIAFATSSSVPSAVAVKEQYQIGTLYFTLFETVNETEVTLLNNLYGEYVSLNDRVQASQYCLEQDSTTCQEQASGTKYWGLTRITRRQGPPVTSSDIYRYNQHGNGENVKIFIVDSGVEVQHSAFSSRASHGMTAQSLKQAEGDTDQNGHGTHVAGLAGGDPYGVARNSEIVAVKVLDMNGSGSVDWILEGFQWISQNKPESGVINLSLGLTGSNSALEAAVQEMVELGLTVVAAAGNEDIDACYTSPARSPYAITVGATNQNDELTTFTNYGTCVDILAPGQAILSSIPGNSEYILHGTSMAAPLVAGVAASILSRNIHYTPAQVRETLDEAATTGAIGNADKFNTADKLLYTCDTCIQSGGNQLHVIALPMMTALYVSVYYL